MKQELIWICMFGLWACVCSQANVSNPCVGASYCHTCITSSPLCGWCAHLDYLETSRDGCDLMVNFNARSCYKANLSNSEEASPLCNNHGTFECDHCICDHRRSGKTCARECDESLEYQQPASPLCNHHGTLICGQCTCDQGHYGEKCECDASQVTAEQCFKPSSDVACSGRGQCVCGVCECFPRRPHSAQKYSGQFCDCDDYSCPYHNNQLCGGHGHGVCTCGECRCEPGYTGEGCGCPTSNEACLTTAGIMCNGVGECECGMCKCDSGSGYKGPTCEECPTCPDKCSENKNCALCVGFKSGPLTQTECDEKCNHVTVVQTLSEEAKHNDYATLCLFRDEEDDCRYDFTYWYIYRNELAVVVQQTKACPGSANIVATKYVHILAIVLGIVLSRPILL